MNLVRKTLSGFTALLSGQIIQGLLQVAVLMILARMIDKESFGLLTAATVVTHFASIFVTVGVGPSLIQTRELTPAHLSTGLIFSAACGFLLSVCLFFLAGPLGVFMKSDRLAGILRVLCWIFPIEGMGLIAQSRLRRNLEFKKIALIEVLSYLFGYGLAGIGLALLGYQIWALVWAVFLQTLLRNGLFFFSVPRASGLRWDGAALKSMLTFGGGLTLSQVATYCATHIDKIVVGKTLGIVPLGVYGRAITLTATFARLFGQTLTRVLFPVFSRVQAEQRLLYSAFEKGIQSIALITLPLCILNIVCGREIVLILLGPQWEETVVPFQIVSVGLFFRTAIKIGDSITLATGAVYRKAWRQYLYLVSVFAFSLLGSYWGIEGIAWGVTGAWIFNFLLISDLSIRLVGMNRFYFVSLMTRPAAVTALGAVPLLGLTRLLRAGEHSAIVIVAAGALALALYMGIFLFSGLSRFLLGPTAPWFRDQAARALRRLSCFFRKKEGDSMP